MVSEINQNLSFNNTSNTNYSGTNTPPPSISVENVFPSSLPKTKGKTEREKELEDIKNKISNFFEKKNAEAIQKQYEIGLDELNKLESDLKTMTEDEYVKGIEAIIGTTLGLYIQTKDDLPEINPIKCVNRVIAKELETNKNAKESQTEAIQTLSNITLGNLQNMPDYGAVKQLLNDTVVDWFGGTTRDDLDEKSNAIIVAINDLIASKDDPETFCNRYDALTGVTFNPEKIKKATEEKELYGRIQAYQCVYNVLADEKLKEIITDYEENPNIVKGIFWDTDKVTPMKNAYISIIAKINDISEEEAQKFIEDSYNAEYFEKNHSKLSEEDKNKLYYENLKDITSDECIKNAKEKLEQELNGQSFEAATLKYQNSLEQAFGKNELAKMIEANTSGTNLAYGGVKLTAIIAASLLTAGLGGGSTVMAFTGGGTSFIVDATEYSTDNNGFTKEEFISASKDAVVTSAFIGVGGIANKAGRLVANSGNLSKLESLNSTAVGVFLPKFLVKMCPKGAGFVTELGVDTGSSYGVCQVADIDTTLGNEAMESGVPQVIQTCLGGFGRCIKGSLVKTDSLKTSTLVADSFSPNPTFTTKAFQEVTSESTAMKEPVSPPTTKAEKIQPESKINETAAVQDELKVFSAPIRTDGSTLQGINDFGEIIKIPLEQLPKNINIYSLPFEFLKHPILNRTEIQSRINIDVILGLEKKFGNLENPERKKEFIKSVYEHIVSKFDLDGIVNTDNLRFYTDTGADPSWGYYENGNIHINRELPNDLIIHTLLHELTHLQQHAIMLKNFGEEGVARAQAVNSVRNEYMNNKEKKNDVINRIKDENKDYDSLDESEKLKLQDQAIAEIYGSNVYSKQVSEKMVTAILDNTRITAKAQAVKTERDQYMNDKDIKTQVIDHIKKENKDYDSLDENEKLKLQDQTLAEFMDTYTIDVSDRVTSILDKTRITAKAQAVKSVRDEYMENNKDEVIALIKKENKDYDSLDESEKLKLQDQAIAEILKDTYTNKVFAKMVTAILDITRISANAHAVTSVRDEYMNNQEIKKKIINYIKNKNKDYDSLDKNEKLKLQDQAIAGILGDFYTTKVSNTVTSILDFMNKVREDRRFIEYPKSSKERTEAASFLENERYYIPGLEYIDNKQVWNKKYYEQPMEQQAYANGCVGQLRYFEQKIEDITSLDDLDILKNEFKTSCKMQEFNNWQTDIDKAFKKTESILKLKEEVRLSDTENDILKKIREIRHGDELSFSESDVEKIKDILIIYKLKYNAKDFSELLQRNNSNNKIKEIKTLICKRLEVEDSYPEDIITTINGKSKNSAPDDNTIEAVLEAVRSQKKNG